jgi:hypothetical protein
MALFYKQLLKETYLLLLQIQQGLVQISKLYYTN